MNFVAQVEEHLRDLGAEARKKHPGVKEASERAILQLRTLQNAYVTAVRKASQASSGGKHPTTALFQSQDLLRPFLLAANYPNASLQLLEISLKGMSLLIKGNAICPGDGIHMVRVWTIQANVCASTLSAEKKTASNISSSGASSSWFGLLSSSTPDVSSSSGQGLPQRKEASEKMALELLRCLVLLLESEELPVIDEQWTASIALSCILGHVQAPVVQQAAKTTLHQVLSLLFKSNTNNSIETWRDLLILASQERTSLRGSFSKCKSSAPSPTLCLELTCQIIRGNTQWFRDNVEEIELESLQVAISLLRDKKATSFELVWRSYDFASAVLVTSVDYDDEDVEEEHGEILVESETCIEEEELRQLDDCREQLIGTLVQSINHGTEACRNNHDFEDGFIYTREVDNTKSTKLLATLIPDSILWRAGLALETLYLISGKNPKWTASITEAVSDFATIGASCRDHMLQLVSSSQKSTSKVTKHVVSCESNDNSKLPTMVPSLFRRAEEIQSAVLTSIKSSENPKKIPSTACSIGDTLLIAFHCLLKSCLHVDEEISFSPSLAILQHFLKRFPGSREIVHGTLVGYNRLAHIIQTGNALQRKAFVSSLCKLSLPSWGKYDDATQLQDHNMEVLVCMLQIVHKHRENLMSEWYMILWTLEELSTLNISSPKLSDEGYRTAIIVSITYSRLAPFTTVLSLESLSSMLDALIEIAKSPKVRRGDITMEHLERTGYDVDKRDKKPAKEDGSIGGKLISFAGKAILGAEKSIENGRETNDQHTYTRMKPQRVKETYGEKYQREVTKSLTASRLFRSELLADVPLSLLMITDICLANTFRFKTCGSIISSYLCKLAGSSKEARAYAMETLSLLVKSQLSEKRQIPNVFVGPAALISEDPARIQLLEVKVEDKTTSREREGSISQVDLLQPLCSTIKMTKQAGVAEAGINSLHSLLEGSGQNLNGKVWAIVIDAVSSLAGNSDYQFDRTGLDWSTCCMLGFRGLKLIVDDFLEELPPPSDDSSIAPRKALMECCSSFGSSRHDLNTSLTAIGLLWTIADQDADTSSIERALAKLVLLAGDSRSEVRNCAVNSLFSCIVGRGQNFSVEQWERCISDNIFGVYNQVLYRGGESNKEEWNRLTATKQKYKTSVHHSRDSADKQWSNTEVLVLSGLIRVLRNNFNQLLETTSNVRLVIGESSTCARKPWLVSAWYRMLELAVNAAKQTGGRDTLDLRLAGVDLMVLCCQLSSRAGIQAALTPARVGTNMQVVNGALRSVGEAKVFRASGKKTSNIQVSESMKLYRDELFKISFDTLGVYKKHLEEVEKEVEERKPYFMEPVQVQVLHRLAGGLSKLHDCCKSEELSPNRHIIQSRLATEQFLALETENNNIEDFEARFVELVGIIVKKAICDQARFFTQAQRSAMDLLKEMVINGSNQALKVLASMAGPAFFWSTEGEMCSGSKQDGIGIEILSREAASVVSDQIKNDKLLDEPKAQVLCMLLSVFVAESDKESWKLESKVSKRSSRKRNYKLFIPVMEEGLASAKKLGSSKRTNTLDLLDLLWERVDMVLSQMLSPIYISSHAPYVSQASNLAELIKSAVAHVPSERLNEVAVLLSSGALKSVDIARDHAAAHDNLEPNDGKIRSKKRYDEALKMCRECMIGLCKLQPKSFILQSISKQVFDDVITAFCSKEQKKSIRNTNVQIARITCQAIKLSEDMDSLIIALFPKLCLLISVDHTALRTEVAAVMETVDIGERIKKMTSRTETAEQQARELDDENKQLKITVKELREKNVQLQHEIAIFSTSSSLS